MTESAQHDTPLAPHIAPLSEQQLKAALELNAAVFDLDYFERMTEEADLRATFDAAAHRRPQAFVATLDGDVVGTIRCKESKLRENSYVIQHLAVDPAHRGRNIGHALVAFTEAALCRQLPPDGAATLFVLDGTKKTHPQSTFYEDMGYTPDGRRIGDYAVLQKKLAGPSSGCHSPTR